MERYYVNYIESAVKPQPTNLLGCTFLVQMFIQSIDVLSCIGYFLSLYIERD